MERQRRRRERGETSTARAGHRHARLEHLITELVDALVRDELSDPALTEVALTGAVLSEDRHHIHLLFTAPDVGAAAVALGRASTWMRAQVADRLATKRVPEVHFVPDPRADTCLE